MFFLVLIFAFVSLCTGAPTGNDLEVEKRILLEDSYYTIMAKLDALEKEVAMLKDQSAHSHSAIAFMAELTTSVSGTGHHIYFDDVKLNLGNAYNPHHGMFVAPVNGTYQFGLTSCSNSGHVSVLQVNVNNNVLGKVLAGDSSYTECSSKIMLSHLMAGDDVFVQNANYGDLVYVNPTYGKPSFSGFLIQAD